jgi:DNA-binding NarL/FixJ family response regulator
VAGVVVGTFEYPLMGEGLLVALERDARFELLAADVADSSLARVLERERPDVAVLDERNAEKPEALRVALARRPDTRIVMLARPPASTPVLQLIAEGATCLSKAAPVADVLAIILLAAEGNVVVQRDLASSSPRAHLIRSLTPREREVLAHLERGERDSEIARALQISIVTVRTHNANIFRKTGARRRDLLRSTQA